ncbi:MAG: helix-turn-helix transcriptional regulator [Clostridia bacterium]|nr:helix-turn-helix transcriptional regulator [Clostridia bacterium]
MKSFGETIFEARMEQGWSLREAAANIGISHTYLSAIEKEYDPRTGNPVTPSPDSLLKICNAYHLPYRETAVFTSVNEGDVRKFLIQQLKMLRKTDPKTYRAILSEAEKE